MLEAPRRTKTTSPSEAKERKRKGIRKATKSAGPWAAKARAMIEKMPSGHTFTAEDLRSELKKEPPHRNAWGTLFHNAAAAGLIVRMGFCNGERPASHSRIIATWKRV